MKITTRINRQADKALDSISRDGLKSDTLAAAEKFEAEDDPKMAALVYEKIGMEAKAKEMWKKYGAKEEKRISNFADYCQGYEYINCADAFAKAGNNEKAREMLSRAIKEKGDLSGAKAEKFRQAEGFDKTAALKVLEDSLETEAKAYEKLGVTEKAKAAWGKIAETLKDYKNIGYIEYAAKRSRGIIND